LSTSSSGGDAALGLGVSTSDSCGEDTRSTAHLRHFRLHWRPLLPIGEADE
jgi:hypothetical protein